MTLQQAISNFYSRGQDWSDVSGAEGWNQLEQQYGTDAVVQAVEHAQSADMGDVTWVSQHLTNNAVNGPNTGGSSGDGVSGGSSSESPDWGVPVPDNFEGSLPGPANGSDSGSGGGSMGGILNQTNLMLIGGFAVAGLLLWVVL